MFGVLLFPHLEYPIIHYIFAGLFFIGSALVIALFNDRKHRKISVIIAIISLSSILLCAILPDKISLLLAEWISLGVISIHYILESKGLLTN